MKKYKDVAEFCKMVGITEDQFYGKVPVDGYLDLRVFEEIPDGFSPVVRGFLELDNLKKIPKGFDPVVREFLDLSNVCELPEGFSPVVGGNLNLYSVRKLHAGFSPVVGGNVNLYSLPNLPKGFAPMMGGCLFLDSVHEIPEGFNPVVGGYVYHLEKWDYSYQSSSPVFSWRDGKYIMVEGILTEVVSRRNGVCRVKTIGDEQISYLVTDGVWYAHGATLAEARVSLKFKIGDRDTSKFENLPLTHKMTASQTIECYRVITGACEFGVRDFIQRKFGGKTKKSYTIAEVIKFTEGEYGHQTFRDFFVK